MLQALQIRDFRLLWGGSLISSFGSWLLNLAIPAHVFQVTGSLRDAGLTLAAQYLPGLVLGPVAGVFTDRWDKRRLMIGTSMFRACAVAAMLTGLSPGHYWVLYAALIAENAGGALYVPASRARTPVIVGTGDPAEQRQLPQRLRWRRDAAHRRTARRDPADSIRRQMADLR